MKLKRPKQLQEILGTTASCCLTERLTNEISFQISDIARYLLSEIQTKAAEVEIEEKQGKLEQLKSVLEM